MRSRPATFLGRWWLMLVAKTLHMIFPGTERVPGLDPGRGLPFLRTFCAQSPVTMRLALHASAFAFLITTPLTVRSLRPAHRLAPASQYALEEAAGAPEEVVEERSPHQVIQARAGEGVKSSAATAAPGPGVLHFSLEDTGLDHERPALLGEDRVASFEDVDRLAVDLHHVAQVFSQRLDDCTRNFRFGQ